MNPSSFFSWTDIINYTSFSGGSGFAYDVGLHWEPDDMFASNKLCLLISLWSFSTTVRRYIHVHPAVRPQIPEQLQSVHSCQRWSSCSTCVQRLLWLLGAQRRGTRAGTERHWGKRMWSWCHYLQGSFRSLTHKIVETHGQKITDNRFPLASLTALCSLHFDCVC